MLCPNCSAPLKKGHDECDECGLDLCDQGAPEDQFNLVKKYYYKREVCNILETGLEKLRQKSAKQEIA